MITASMVKELREKTGAGMMECKNALSEAAGEIEKAILILREKGLAKAQNKANRLASEGLVEIFISDDKQLASIVEVNSETDFVAKNETFKDFVKEIAKRVSIAKNHLVDDFLLEAWDKETTIKEMLHQKISIIGENLKIRRFSVLKTDGFLASYNHGNGKIAVIAEFKGKSTALTEEMGKNICMQIAALRPLFISEKDISEDFIQTEKEILKQQILKENINKPENIIEKMIEGRWNKYLKEICLLNQAYVKDPDISVLQYMEHVAKEVGSPITINAYVRYETGEGLEKKVENFEEEVKKAME